MSQFTPLVALMMIFTVPIGALCAEPGTRPSTSRERSVCQALQKNAVERVPFALLHAVLQRPCWRPIAGMARIDVDNDGHADNLIRVDVCFRECETTGLAVADQTRTQVADDELNGLLAPLGGGCGPKLDVFTHDGRTYIEAVHPGGKRSVLLMTKEQPRVREICVLAPPQRKR